MGLMGNHGYDESTDLGEIQGAQDDAEHFARTVDEALWRDECLERDYLAEVERRDAAEVAELLDLDV
ncbi:hypothetical protein ACQP2T_63935 (plasmid) [Nonomuraea sp. CA-143628]|uniref:hypothetical protein n=1 Tax=Nonomuraea sp. CA-143628 TaxID=3239997 RepID=UPI003D8BF933